MALQRPIRIDNISLRFPQGTVGFKTQSLVYKHSAVLFDANQVHGADRCALVEGTTQAPETCEIRSNFGRFRGSRHV